MNYPRRISNTSNPEENDPLQLVCKKNVVGEIGRGPVDYVVAYEKMNIILTEAKRENIVGCIQQNVRQQEASRQQYVRGLAGKTDKPGSERKRNYDELLSDCEKVPLYGIVSTGADWIFLRHCPGQKDENMRLVSAEKVCHYC